MPLKPNRYRIKPKSRVRLADFDSNDDGGLDKEAGAAEFAGLSERLVELQELLYAEHKRGVLVVLQAMDAAGKDSTIRSVFGPVNPQGCRTISFKAPTETERNHDFLWRIHRHAPPHGHLHIFNRSHYEDVLAARVKKLVEKKQWKSRYEHINAFERLLVDDGAVIVKFFLHISKAYQKEQFEERLAEPHKRWKFNPGDLDDRALWNEYQSAYEDALSKCSPPHAPWYVVPAERKWFRNLLITRVLVETLEGLKMKYPSPTFDPRSFKIT